MSHSVLVFSPNANFADSVGSGSISAAAGAAMVFLEEMIAKEENLADGTFAVHLAPGFCVMEIKAGYAVYACSGEFHVSDPLIIFPKGSVLRAIGDHEFECHHKSLPIN